MGLESIFSVFDSYSRRARLYPAVLALAPIIIAVISQHNIDFGNKSSWLIIIIFSGVIYLVMHIVREMGRRIEQKLYASWGGKPTTQLLRHRDVTIDSVTKSRYHEFLSKKIGKRFPTNTEESDNPTQADDIYQSAIKWLLDNTRDKKHFSILFEENVSYGFQRNSLAIKKFALSCCMFSFFYVIVSEGIVSLNAIYLKKFLSMSQYSFVSITFSLAFVVIWLAFFTARNSKAAAFIYAEMLLRACDVLHDLPASKR